MKAKKSSLFTRIAVVGTLLGSIVTNSFAMNKPLEGICHGPFRQGQTPEYLIFPTETQVRQDVSLNNKIAKAQRTFGCDYILYRIPEFCHDVGLDCYVGSWVSDDALSNQQNMNNLISISNQGFETTKMLIVGNEYLLWRGFSAENTIIPLINQVKAATDLPVTCAETYNTYLQHPNLANAVDVLGIHIYPYWEGVSIDNAAQFVVDKYNLVKQTYSGKEVVILETGWPTDGSAYYSAVPSEANQKKFLEDFVPLAKQNNIKYFIFEGYDEPWKAQYSDVEDHWGVFYENRTLKPQLESILNTNPGNLNSDGRVDYNDFKILTDNWLNPYNFNDYAVFADNFGWTKI